MRKKNNRKISKKIKGIKDLILNTLLSLIFINGAKAQSMPKIEYGPDPSFLPNPLYGISTPGETLSRFIPFIVGVFLVFVAAPITGLIWYRKHGGRKKWPKVVVWILAILFTLALAAFIILLYN